MARMIALMMFCLGTMNAFAQDPKDPLQLYREAIKSPERENYVLSFEVTYPISKKHKNDERIKREYVIRVRGDERYSIITRYFKDKETDNKKYTSQQFILPAFSIYYETGPHHIDFNTNPGPNVLEHDHNVDYRKLGRLTYSFGGSNGTPLSEYDRYFTQDFVKKTISPNEIEYTATHPRVVSTVIFKDGNTAYPAVSKVVYKDEKITIEQMNVVKCGNDKSFPIEIDHYDRHSGELIEHQCIRNIKFGPLPADFVFTPTLLNIPINAEAFQDRMRIVHWDGRKFVHNRVPVGP